MCTSVLYNKEGLAYFGRNLDLQFAMGNGVSVTPRNYPFEFKETDAIKSHAAMVGMAIIADGFPLYFEGVNEFGVGVTGLNFSGFCEYNSEHVEGKSILVRSSWFLIFSVRRNRSRISRNWLPISTFGRSMFLTNIRQVRSIGYARIKIRQ